MHKIFNLIPTPPKGLILALLIIAVLVSQMQLSAIRKDKNRLKVNLEESFREHQSELTLTKSEFDLMVEQQEEYGRVLGDCLNIRTRQVERMSKTVASMHARVTAQLQRSTVKIDGREVESLTFRKEEPHFTVEGTILDNTIALNFTSYDTLYLVTYGYKPGTWFLPKLFSKRRFKTDVTNTNPFIKYMVVEHITIQK
jgi:hypothetical protein